MSDVNYTNDNALFINFNGDYLFSVYGNCIDVTTHYRMDCEKKEIYLTIYSLLKPENNKFLDIKNEFFLAISAYNAIELKDYTYFIQTRELANLEIAGWLPRMIIKSDAKIMKIMHQMGQYRFELDAPNLTELELDINAYNIMKLSPETKPSVIETNGTDKYINDPFDPRSYDYDYDPSIT